MRDGSSEAGETLGALGRVCGRASLAQLARRLEGLQAWLATDLAELEQAIGGLGQRSDALDWRAARHLLARPGKRLRPMCLVLASKVGGRGEPGAVRDAAVACELVHAATLLHDDVIDLGETRRGAPSARVVYGNSASILGGDQLLVEALQRVHAPQLLRELLEVISAMVNAEAVQLERRHVFDPQPEAYLRVVHGKTAALFRWALRAGGMLGGLPPRSIAALGAFGAALGVGFQLVDDLLDLEGDPAKTGKSALSDLREGKLTWPLIYAARRSPALAERLETMVCTEEGFTPDAGHLLVAELRRTGALEATRAEADRYARIATAALAELPESRATAALQSTLDLAIRRAS